MILTAFVSADSMVVYVIIGVVGFAAGAGGILWAVCMFIRRYANICSHWTWNFHNVITWLISQSVVSLTQCASGPQVRQASVNYREQDQGVKKNKFVFSCLSRGSCGVISQNILRKHSHGHLRRDTLMLNCYETTFWAGFTPLPQVSND